MTQQPHFPIVVLVPAPSGTPTPVLGMSETVALYRHLDVRGELLYVGITSDPVRRWEQHRETSLWSGFVATTYVQWYPDRVHARAAERRAIDVEDPIFNSARPRQRRSVVQRKLDYLRTGRTDALRRVPCRFEPGGFCHCCGPDAKAWSDAAWVRVSRESLSC